MEQKNAESIDNFILWSWWHKAQYLASFSSPKPQNPPACTWFRLELAATSLLSPDIWLSRKATFCREVVEACLATNKPTCLLRYAWSHVLWQIYCSQAWRSMPAATSSALCSGMSAKVKGKKSLMWATDATMMWTASGYMAAFINIINNT